MSTQYLWLQSDYVTTQRKILLRFILRAFHTLYGLAAERFPNLRTQSLEKRAGDYRCIGLDVSLLVVACVVGP